MALQTNNFKSIPLSLYIHLPWCVRKCPYCDFNSHPLSKQVDYEGYVQRLITDFSQAYPLLHGRPIKSVFFGGGTPSLFSARVLAPLMECLFKQGPIDEVTLEANPGTLEYDSFEGYAAIGINRISLGVQSFHDESLKALGRIHDVKQVFKAIENLNKSSITNWNIDLMYGLPQQNINLCLQDLEQALACNPTHLSWYQLTLEPNTKFYVQPPPLPEEETLWHMHNQGHLVLEQHGFKPYEVSAFTEFKACEHNLNYWRFGDYLGIGAGAHSKITQDDGRVFRFIRYRHPKDYMDPNKAFIQSERVLDKDDLMFEFMLNHLRLNERLKFDLFKDRTGLSPHLLAPKLQQAEDKGLILQDAHGMETTPLGRLYLNDLIGYFLNEHPTELSSQS